jgi:hypothetical protein
VSAAAPTAAAPSAGGFDLARIVRTAPTPTRIRALLYAAWALSLLLLVVGSSALYRAHAAMKTVGLDTAPSIIAAQEINSGLADLDANAGNYLLGNKAHQVASGEAFEKRRTQITAALVKAAGNVTYGESERLPINTLFDGLGRYLEYISETRYRKDIGDAAGAASTYGAATDLMHQRLMPAGDSLDAANRLHLDLEYHEEQDQSLAAAAGAGLVGGLLVAVLIGAQLYLARRMRRIFNVPLLAATGIAVGYSIYLVTRIMVARADLHVAKEDAFESIHALWKARAIAYDANGDETRYLLGGPRAGSFEQAYRDKVQKLGTTPQVDEAVLQQKRLPVGYKGLFADEIANVTFPGEREAAIRMVKAFGDYDRIDQRMRLLERSGKHDQAVELCIGNAADQSNAAFDRFDKALHDVVDINHKQFDATVKEAMSVLVVAGMAGPVAALLVALLALFGLRVRLREYAA